MLGAIFTVGWNGCVYRFFKVSPDAANAFSFFEKKNEEFYNLLSKHAMKALGIVAKIVDEVRYSN